ncbi:MAG: hypothetical protein HQL75_04360 [Magnetococcales bacterium]|nr:hypothetical protein [Magnetococcales bacterium]
MSQNTSMRVFDWGDMVTLADDGHYPPMTTYEFSNGRKFTCVTQPAQTVLSTDGPGLPPRFLHQDEP